MIAADDIIKCVRDLPSLPAVVAELLATMEQEDSGSGSGSGGRFRRKPRPYVSDEAAALRVPPNSLEAEQAGTADHRRAVALPNPLDQVGKIARRMRLADGQRPSGSVDQRLRVFRQTQGLSLEFHEKYTSGRIIARQTSDLEALRELLDSGVSSLASGMLFMVFTAITVFALDWRSGLLVLASKQANAFNDKADNPVRLELRRQLEGRAECRLVLVDQEPGAVGRDLEQVAPRLPEIERAEIVALNQTGTAHAEFVQLRRFFGQYFCRRGREADLERHRADPAVGEVERQGGDLRVQRVADPDPAAYEKLVAEADADYEGYWARLAREFVTWKTPFTKTLDTSNAPFFKWFDDGTLKFHSDKTAIVYINGVNYRVRFDTQKAQYELTRIFDGVKATSVTRTKVEADVHAGARRQAPSRRRANALRPRFLRRGHRRQCGSPRRAGTA